MCYNNKELSDRAEVKKYQFSSLGLETGNKNVLGISLCLLQLSSLKNKHALTFKL